MNKEIDILFACDMNESRPWFRDRLPGINKAIQNTSYTIKMIDIYSLLGKHEHMPTHVSHRESFLQNADLLAVNQHFENEVLSLNPKVLILGTADNYTHFLIPKTIGNLRKHGIYVAGILGDDEFNYPNYQFLLGWFDLFIAYVKPCVDYYEKFNLSKGFYLPNSCYLNNKKFDKCNQEAEFDAILVGAPIANRPKMVEALIAAGLNIGIFGSKKWDNYAFAKDSYYGFISTSQFDEILSKGKIVLAFLEDHLSGKLHMNTKIWEAVRVARLPISTYYEPLYNDYGLTEGVDILTYKNTEELVEKVKYYSENYSERIEVTKNLYRQVEGNLDYSILYARLFNQLMDVNSQNIDINQCDANLYQSVEENKAIRYFPSIESCLDSEVTNILHILDRIDKNSYDYIYFNKIEKGKRVISHWPFVTFDSIIFLSDKKSKLYYYFIFFKSFFTDNKLHIRQFCVISSGQTNIGIINRAIESLLATKFGYNLNQIFKKRDT